MDRFLFFMFLLLLAMPANATESEECDSQSQGVRAHLSMLQTKDPSKLRVSLGALDPEEQAGAPRSSFAQANQQQQANHSGMWKTIDVFVGSAQEIGSRHQRHSQAGQDWLVSSLLGCKTNGYFIDLAANAAETLSNTLMLERDFAWQGLCIEPNMDYYYDLPKRKCHLVAAAVGGPTDTVVSFNLKGVFGGVVGEGFDNKKADGRIEKQFHTVALGEVLERFGAPTIIDYLSLDVEGAESVVMQGFPWDRYQFNVLTLERPKKDLVEALLQHGYVKLRTNSVFGDETWVHTSLPGFKNFKANWSSWNLPESCMDSEGYTRPADW
ncbi:unnamed protein product [Polarella glacialis]|uniref:Methyltransferase FkbM domain-containing protein n=1 Tax=Polarella glacialis TaxID=89957 RepID=A0A813FJT6_POLGL|nr:unnamed protein product [Polarella glacialis]